MTLDAVMTELAAKGSESIKRTLTRHGAVEPFFGVKVADLKVIQKRIKGNQALALELYATGNSDAMYLAGLVADGSRMTVAQLQEWAEKAPWSMISGCTVPWVTAEHPDAIGLALHWIESPEEKIACSGWATLSAVASVWPDDRLPLGRFSDLLERVMKELPRAPNRVRYQMNGFVICVGTYIEALGGEAMDAAHSLGRVEVDMGDTACEVPEAGAYILKSRRGAPVAKKRKTARC